MELARDKYQRYGLIGTIVFHTILFLIFIFFGLTTPVPIPEEMIAISFGNSSEGTGEIQPQQITSASQQETVSEQRDPNPASSSDPVVTQSNTDATSVNTDKKTNDPVKEQPKETEKIVNKNALFPGNTNATNPSGQGNTGNPGDQGNPNGNPDSDSPNGSYKGDPNYSLGSRKALTKPKEENTCGKTGKVVVEIKVDRKGNVIKATPGVAGTTETAPCLMGKAEKAAMLTKWEADPNAPEIQRGFITYNFGFN